MTVRSAQSINIPSRRRGGTPVTVKLLEFEGYGLYGSVPMFVAVHGVETCCPDAPVEMMHETKAEAKNHASRLVALGAWS